MTFNYRDIVGLDFRQLVAYVESTRLADTGEFFDWRVLLEHFMEGLVAHCEELTEPELRNCVELAETLFSGAERYGDHNRSTQVHWRFELSASLLERLGPRPGVRFLDPVVLLRDYLVELPMSLAEARQKASHWRTLDVSEIWKLRECAWQLNPLKRVDHLFPESADLSEYRKWKELQPELP